MKHFTCKDEFQVRDVVDFFKAVTDVNAKNRNTCAFQANDSCSEHMGFDCEPTGWRPRT